MRELGKADQPEPTLLKSGTEAGGCGTNSRDVLTGGVGMTHYSKLLRCSGACSTTRGSSLTCHRYRGRRRSPARLATDRIRRSRSRLRRRCQAGPSSAASCRGAAMSRCGHVAVCTINGWHRKTSPARPVACTTVRHMTDGRTREIDSSPLIPVSPAGFRILGIARCDVGEDDAPTRMAIVFAHVAEQEQREQATRTRAHVGPILAVDLVTALNVPAHVARVLLGRKPHRHRAADTSAACPAAGTDQRVVRRPQRGRGTGGLKRTTLRAADPHNGTSPRRPVTAHTLPGKCCPDGFPAGGGDVWIDGTAYGEVPVPLELLDLAAVHGTSLPNTPAPGINIRAPAHAADRAQSRQHDSSLYVKRLWPGLVTTQDPSGPIRAAWSMASEHPPGGCLRRLATYGRCLRTKGLFVGTLSPPNR